MLIDAAKLMLFPALMAFAASSDLLTMTISNRISLLLAVIFLGMALAIGMHADEITAHIAAGLVVLLVAFVFFALGWIGGGDAKLAAATALWLGWPHLLEYLLYASLIGGALTLGLLELRRHPLPTVFAGFPWAERLHQPNGGIPYGIALAAAALLVYPYTSWVESLVR